MATLYRNIGSKTEKNLLAHPDAEKISVPMLPGEGVVESGTVIYRTADGFWAPAAAANVANTNQLAVLKADIDTGTEAAGVAEDAIAYRSGKFIKGAVTLKAGAALAEAQRVVLRGQGIVFGTANTDGDFDKEVAAEENGES